MVLFDELLSLLYTPTLKAVVKVKKASVIQVGGDMTSQIRDKIAVTIY